MLPVTTMSGGAARSGLEVWRLQVSEELQRLAEHWRQLDAAERQRASRFRRASDRARFVIARGSLRQLLGRKLGIGGADVTFATNEFGKPRLDNVTPAWHFNTSHSGDWVLHAIDPVATLGIDVEAVRPELACIDSFEGVLSRQEMASLRALPEPQLARAFATVWVRKEAYVKALGVGLVRPLRDICIGVDGHGRPDLVLDRHADGTAASWRFEDIEVDADHVACLVHRRDD